MFIRSNQLLCDVCEKPKIEACGMRAGMFLFACRDCEQAFEESDMQTIERIRLASNLRPLFNPPVSRVVRDPGPRPSTSPRPDEAQKEPQP
jgi:hypothetical protein